MNLEEKQQTGVKDLALKDHKVDKVEKVKGELTFEDKVIQKIIGIALENIDGLLTVDGGFFSNLAEKIVNTDNVTAGINTEVGKEQVAVDLDVVVEYGKDIEKIFEEMKQLISTEVAKMTHLEVIEVNVNVKDIKTREQFEEDSESLQDKASEAASTTGEYLSHGLDKAKKVAKQGEEKIDDATEPRVK